VTVFAVLAHDDPELLARLVARLAPHPVVVHVDGRHALTPFRAALHRHPHARFVEHGRVRTNWGGWSLVDAVMRVYAEALPSMTRHEQVVLLSGHCYPLRPVDEIVAELRDAPRPLHLRGVAYSAVGDVSRTRRWHVYDLFPVRQRGWRRIVHGVPRKVAQAITARLPERRLDESDLALGSHWSVLTREVIEDVVVPALDDLRPRLRWTASPEETFFPTAVHRSPASALTQHGGLDAHDGDSVARYANVHLLDDSMVKTYDLADADAVTASRALFVRKVSTARSGALLDLLDERAGWSPGT
jgi:hypothetical protein